MSLLFGVLVNVNDFDEPFWETSQGSRASAARAREMNREVEDGGGWREGWREGGRRKGVVRIGIRRRIMRRFMSCGR